MVKATERQDIDLEWSGRFLQCRYRGGAELTNVGAGATAWSVIQAVTSAGIGSDRLKCSAMVWRRCPDRIQEAV